MNNIDLKLFKKQLNSLNKLLVSNKLTATTKEHLEGLQNLLEDLYDAKAGN